MGRKKGILIGYILACIFVVAIFTQVLLSIKMEYTGGTQDLGVISYSMSKTYENQVSVIRGYESAFFWPALVCCIIGTISALVKYKRGLVVAMGFVTTADLLVMVYMTAFTKDFLIEKFLLGFLMKPVDLKSAGIEVVTSTGLCFYLGIAAAVLMGLFSILTFIFVPADQ